MPNAPIPVDETERLAALRQLDDGQSPAAEYFDALVRAASLVCDVPISLVSLVESERQWFKAKIGMAVNETPRDVSFCAHAIVSDDLLEVPDATQDPRFMDNPVVVGASHVRFYAGVPLRLSNGHRLGALCVIDRRPRQLTRKERDILLCLGKAASALLEQWRIASELRRVDEQRQRQDEALEKSASLLEQIGSVVDLGVWELNLHNNVVQWSPQTCRIHGMPPDHQPSLEAAIGFFPTEARRAVLTAIDAAIETGEPWDLELPLIRADGERIHVRSVGHAAVVNGKATRLAGTFQDVTKHVEQRERSLQRVPA